MTERITFHWRSGGRNVQFTGSMVDWRKTPMKREGEVWSLSLDLSPGKYEYKFIVDGVWKIDQDAFYLDDGFGNVNNRLVIDSLPSRTRVISPILSPRVFEESVDFFPQINTVDEKFSSLKQEGEGVGQTKKRKVYAKRSQQPKDPQSQYIKIPIQMDNDSKLESHPKEKTPRETPRENTTGRSYAQVATEHIPKPAEKNIPIHVATENPKHSVGSTGKSSGEKTTVNIPVLEKSFAEKNIPIHVAPEKNIPIHVAPEKNIPIHVAPEKNIPIHVAPEKNIPIHVAPEKSYAEALVGKGSGDKTFEVKHTTEIPISSGKHSTEKTSEEKSSEEKPSEEKNNEEEEKKPKKKDLTGDGGVIKEILKKGSGQKPSSGSDVFVHYVGTLLDGTKFDSSRDRNDPFKFKLNSGSVIKGWDKVVATMKKGEICKATLSSDYAYGETGSGKIPPGATLIFEIELLSWTSDETLDDGIIKKVIAEGRGYKKPRYESVCTVNLKVSGADNGSVYHTNGKDSQSFTIGCEEMLPGLEKALESMKEGEIAEFKIPGELVKGGINNIPANTPLKYEIELKKISKDTDSFATFEEKEKATLQRKKEGNEFFEKGKIDFAIKKYEKALDLIGDGDKEHKEKVDREIKLPIHLNLAASFLKQKDYEKAIESATKALEIDPACVKGLYRRACALTDKGDWNEAKEDYIKALELEPNNKQIKASFAKLKNIIAKQDERDKKRFQNMWKAMAQEEGKEEEKTSTEEENKEKTEKQ